MCYTSYFYIQIDGDCNFMILCKKTDFDAKIIQKVIREAFPELLTSLTIKLGWKKIKTMVVGCYKLHSSRFDGTINRLETTDWEDIKFMALRLVEKEDEIYCESFPVII